MPPNTPEGDGHAIAIHLDQLLADRGMTLTELSERVGISVVNLSILKNGHARAIRFSTLTRLCQVLGCQPGDLLRHQNPDVTPDSQLPNGPTEYTDPSPGLLT